MRVLLAAVLAAAAAGSATAPLTAPGRLALLAADGGRVAVAVTGIKGSCDRILVWDTQAARSYRAGTNCPGNRGGAVRERVLQLALAGTTAAWLEVSGGDREDLSLNVASPSWKKPRLADYEENGNGASQLVEGDYLGGLFGAGSLLAWDTWHVCTLEPPGQSDPYGIDEPCTGSHATVSVRAHAIDRQHVWRFDGAKRKSVASGATAFPVLTVDATRIAVRTPSGAVALLSPAGATVAAVPVPPGTIYGAALDGNRLAVLKARTLEVFTGARQDGTWPVPLASALCGYAGGLAAFRSGSRVTVLRLSDGKTANVAASLCALTPKGLFTATGRTVAFLPTAELLRHLAASKPPR